jgi:hypothetical protein
MLERAAELVPAASLESMRAHFDKLRTLSPRAGSFITNDALSVRGKKG